MTLVHSVGRFSWRRAHLRHMKSGRPRAWQWKDDREPLLLLFPSLLSSAGADLTQSQQWWSCKWSTGGMLHVKGRMCIEPSQRDFIIQLWTMERAKSCCFCSPLLLDVYSLPLPPHLLSVLDESKGTGHGCAPSGVIFTRIHMRRVRAAQVHGTYTPGHCETWSRRVKGLKLGWGQCLKAGWSVSLV
jgi:hypothetical protein